MPQFVWINSGGAFLVMAPDEDQAFEKVINYRMSEFGQSREEAIGWFEHDDAIHEIDGEIDIPDIVSPNDTPDAISPDNIAAQMDDQDEFDNADRDQWNQGITGEPPEFPG